MQRQFIASGVARGMSGVDILQALSQGGIGIRREAGLALIREVKGIADTGRNLNNIGLNRFFVPSSIPASTAQMQHRFILYSKVTIQWLDSGETETLHNSRYYSELPTRGQHLDIVRASLKPIGGTREYVVLATEITGGAQSVDAYV